jgi:hypothetical protein
VQAASVVILETFVCTNCPSLHGTERMPYSQTERPTTLQISVGLCLCHPGM